LFGGKRKRRGNNDKFCQIKEKSGVPGEKATIWVKNPDRHQRKERAGGLEEIENDHDKKSKGKGSSFYFSRGSQYTESGG